MEELLNLLKLYWKPIVGLIFTIVGFVVAIVKKKPVSSIVDDIYLYSIQAITSVERPGEGADKLKEAISYVITCLKNKYPTLDTGKYVTLITSVIESILTTPQKKG